MNSKAETKKKRSLFRKIINVFIGISAAIVILLVVFVGFSQTQTFREYIRNEILTQVNPSINGNFEIEKIDGTIFTSLYLRNTSLSIETDTLFFAENIEINTNPLQLLLRKLYFRNISLENVNISVLQNEVGSWNIDNITKSIPGDTITDSSPDEKGSKFPFKIHVGDLALKNINLVRKSFSNRNSNRSLPLMDTENLEIKNLNLSAQLIADINKSDIDLTIANMSFEPNLENFKLYNLSGAFHVSNRYAEVKNLNVVTDSTNLNISARLGKINLFENIYLEDFENYPLQLELNSKSFYFDDLSSFLDATDILKGKVALSLSADGEFGNFNIRKLIVDYLNTHLEVTGGIRKLHTPKYLFIDAFIKNSNLDYANVNKLLPTLEIPEYDDLVLSKADIKFKGEPTKFNAETIGNIGNGSLNLKSYLDLQSDNPEYDITFTTERLNLESALNLNTEITSKGSFQGTGFDPKEMNSIFNLQVENSLLNGYNIDQILFQTIAKEKVLDFISEWSVNKARSTLQGILDLTEENNPVYNVNGKMKKLNLADFLNKPDLITDLNFDFNIEGKELDIDATTGDFYIGLTESQYKDYDIDSANLELKLDRLESVREISLISDFLDLNVKGEFSLSKAIELLSYEANTISSLISEKINDLNPISLMIDSTISKDQIEIPQIVETKLALDYEIAFKDFDLIAKILGTDKLDIAGIIDGKIENDSSHFSISSEVKLESFVDVERDNVFYLSDVTADINFSRDNSSTSFENLFGALSLTGKRLFTGQEIKNINADLTFNQSKLLFNVYTEIDTLIKTSLEGKIVMTPVEQTIYLDNFWLEYDGIDWKNKQSVTVFFTPDYLRLEEFLLIRDSAVVNFSGIIHDDGKQDITLKASGVPGQIASKYFLGLRDSYLDASVNINAKLQGTLSDPLIKIDFDADNVSYRNVDFGHLLCDISYENKNIYTNVKFLDTTYNIYKPNLSIYGVIPIDLSFQKVDKRLSNTEELNLKFESTNFNLSALGDLLPVMKSPQGYLTANFVIGGIYNDLNYDGQLTITNGAFRAEQNNLDYSYGLKLVFQKNKINIDSLIILNSGGSKYIGTLRANGNFVLDSLSLDEVNLSLYGDLGLLGKRSRAVNPDFYGDLFVDTDGEWKFTYKDSKAFLNGTLLLENVDLTYVAEVQKSGQFSNEFIYEFIVDSSKFDREEIQFQQILSSTKELNAKSQVHPRPYLNLDYNIDVKIEQEASLEFILSKVVNQKLKVNIAGEMKYIMKDGQLLAQGAFNLLSGSQLEFFKTFDAEGSIKFETDITNPYLDIIAIYTSEYETPETGVIEDVAVKIKLTGLLNELGTNLANNPDDISIYIGQRNIQNNIHDNRYDATDAISFILIGKFKDDLTSSDKTQVAGQTSLLGNTAVSFLGPVLTNFVNSVVGDFINNIELKQSGEATKFTVSGKIQNLRYSFGGTTEVFQNINKANIRLDYMFISNLFVSLERKDPIVQSFGIEEKISEFGLKYKFEF